MSNRSHSWMLDRDQGTPTKHTPSSLRQRQNDKSSTGVTKYNNRQDLSPTRDVRPGRDSFKSANQRHSPTLRSLHLTNLTADDTHADQGLDKSASRWQQFKVSWNLAESSHVAAWATRLSKPAPLAQHPPPSSTSHFSPGPRHSPGTHMQKMSPDASNSPSWGPATNTMSSSDKLTYYQTQLTLLDESLAKSSKKHKHSSNRQTKASDATTTTSPTLPNTGTGAQPMYSSTFKPQASIAIPAATPSATTTTSQPGTLEEAAEQLLTRIAALQAFADHHSAPCTTSLILCTNSSSSIWPSSGLRPCPDASKPIADTTLLTSDPSMTFTIKRIMEGAQLQMMEMEFNERQKQLEQEQQPMGQPLQQQALQPEQQPQLLQPEQLVGPHLPQQPCVPSEQQPCKLRSQTTTEGAPGTSLRSGVSVSESTSAAAPVTGGGGGVLDAVSRMKVMRAMHRWKYVTRVTVTFARQQLQRARQSRLLKVFRAWQGASATQRQEKSVAAAEESWKLHHQQVADRFHRVRLLYLSLAGWRVGAQAAKEEDQMAWQVHQAQVAQLQNEKHQQQVAIRFHRAYVRHMVMLAWRGLAARAAVERALHSGASHRRSVISSFLTRLTTSPGAVPTHDVSQSEHRRVPMANSTSGAGVLTARGALRTGPMHSQRNSQVMVIQDRPYSPNTSQGDGVPPTAVPRAAQRSAGCCPPASLLQDPVNQAVVAQALGGKAAGGKVIAMARAAATAANARHKALPTKNSGAQAWGRQAAPKAVAHIQLLSATVAAPQQVRTTDALQSNTQVPVAACGNGQRTVTTGATAVMEGRGTSRQPPQRAASASQLHVHATRVQAGNTRAPAPGQPVRTAQRGAVNTAHVREAMRGARAAVQGVQVVVQGIVRRVMHDTQMAVTGGSFLSHAHGTDDLALDNLQPAVPSPPPIQHHSSCTPIHHQHTLRTQHLAPQSCNETAFPASLPISASTALPHLPAKAQHLVQLADLLRQRAAADVSDDPFGSPPASRHHIPFTTSSQSATQQEFPCTDTCTPHLASTIPATGDVNNSATTYMPPSYHHDAEHPRPSPSCEAQECQSHAVDSARLYTSRHASGLSISSSHRIMSGHRPHSSRTGSAGSNKLSSDIPFENLHQDTSIPDGVATSRRSTATSVGEPHDVGGMPAHHHLHARSERSTSTSVASVQPNGRPLPSHHMHRPGRPAAHSGSSKTSPGSYPLGAAKDSGMGGRSLSQGAAAGDEDAARLLAQAKASAYRRRRSTTDLLTAIGGQLQAEAMHLADLHYQRVLLVRHGLRPWLYLIAQIHVQSQQATRHYQAKTMRLAWAGWRRCLCMAAWSKMAHQAAGVMRLQARHKGQKARAYLQHWCQWAMASHVARHYTCTSALRRWSVAVRWGRLARRDAVLHCRASGMRRVMKAWRAVALQQAGERLVAELQLLESVASKVLEVRQRRVLRAWQAVAAAAREEADLSARQAETWKKVQGWLTEMGPGLGMGAANHPGLGVAGTGQERLEGGTSGSLSHGISSGLVMDDHSWTDCVDGMAGGGRSTRDGNSQLNYGEDRPVVCDMLVSKHEETSTGLLFEGCDLLDANGNGVGQAGVRLDGQLPSKERSESWLSLTGTNTGLAGARMQLVELLRGGRRDGVAGMAVESMGRRSQGLSLSDAGTSLGIRTTLTDNSQAGGSCQAYGISQVEKEPAKQDLPPADPVL